ncbi:hypothetical protein, partial [uncultured Collinsella sp.]|uniref:hypothetical protein n=1 Tax=uncultured Collinsella sp. TaxID=165190 RepID=UPI0025E979A9
QNPLDLGLHEPRRVQGGGPDPLVDLFKKVLPHQRTFTCGRCGVTRTESISKLEQEASTANGGKAEGAGGSLPATGDPASTLGILTASGTAVAALGEALRRRK